MRKSKHTETGHMVEDVAMEQGSDELRYNRV